MKLKNKIKLLAYYRSLGEKCIDRLDEDQIHESLHPESNSVAIMVKHLWGNMLSRWTDFLTSDGEKEWRERDDEFVDDVKDKKHLYQLYNEGWDCLMNTLNSLNDSHLEQIVYIRNEGHTVSEALDRQLAHYAYHTGQLVYLTKLLKGDEWESLSIPKNMSAAYNQEKFSENRKKQHFTDKA